MSIEKESFFTELMEKEGSDITVYVATGRSCSEHTMSNHRFRFDEKENKLTFCDGLDLHNFCSFIFPEDKDICRLVIHKDSNGDTRALSVKENSGVELCITYEN